MNTLFNVSLWGDEAFSAVAAQKPFWQMMAVVIKDTSPPLFYIISFLWFRIFGSSEIAIRSLSLVFYLGTSFIVYLIGKTINGRKTGALAALLTFFNPFLFPYAFEGRMYFCLLFFTTLSFYFLIVKNKVGYILASAAALYSHHFAFLAIASQFLWQLTRVKRITFKNICAVFKTYLIIGILYLPWLYPLYLQTTLVSGGFWLGKPKFRDLINTFCHFLKHDIVFKIQEKIPFLVIASLLLRKWQKRSFSQDLLLIFWAVLPPILAFLISQFGLPIFYERYLLYCVPPIMLLLVLNQRKISYPLIIILLAVFITTSWHYFTHPFKRPFREFAHWIKNNVSKEVFIVNYNGAAHHLWESKYYGIEAPIYSPGGPLPFYVGTAQMSPKDTISQLPAERQIGLISSDSPKSIKISGYQVKNFYQLDSLYFIWLEKQNEKEKP